MPSFQLTVATDYEAMSRAAASYLSEQIAREPDLLLCLATGSSPKRVYQLLAERCRNGLVWCDRLRALKLDEWGGVAMDDPCTCESYLREHFLGPLGIGRERYEGFVSNATDPAAECGRIDQWLADAGPIGVCVLGLGANGHLGLNEPGAALRSRAHVAQLSRATLGHPMLTGTGRVPGYGLTLGMADIMHAGQILLLVNGSHKAEPMRRLMGREISTDFPASMLWLHPSVVCLCDREAVSLATL
jgi:galactosamine-6-phosphate isomerase